MSSFRFFKILVVDFQDQLLIPRRFVKYLDNKATNREAKISVFSGKCYCVKITWDVVLGGYFHGEGWKKIISECDLKFGYFLVFDYHGNLTFDLTIFDYSGCSKAFLEKSDKGHSGQRLASGEHMLQPQVNIPTIEIDDDDDEDCNRTTTGKQHIGPPIDNTSKESIEREEQLKFRSVIRATHFLGRTNLGVLDSTLLPENNV